MKMANSATAILAKNPRGERAKKQPTANGTLTNVVTGKQMCINAPNGAPDCVAASEALCRAKGYQRGASLDITSAYRCPAAFWAERREPNEKDCVNEAFVSKAVCQ